MDGSGIPSGFIALMIIMPLLGLGTWLFRMSVASRMAQRAGLNPTDAAMTSALSDDGLAATYVAANLAAKPVPAGQPVEERLRRLDAMRTSGVINDAEYAEQRKRILDQI